MVSSDLYLAALLIACLALAVQAQQHWDPRYHHQVGHCPPGFRYNYGRCERVFGNYPTQRVPYGSPPEELNENPVPIPCPEGFKAARGVCSKMTEREIELDRLPKEPCPPGQRRSRLVCRPYIYN